MAEYICNKKGGVVQLDGQRFGMWIVVRRDENTVHGSATWRCRCDCGMEKRVHGQSLRNGKSHSCGKCGVIKKIAALSSRSPGVKRLGNYREYNIWQKLKYRCDNPKNKDYHKYGGRGISVCERWRKFDNFFDDMGKSPSKRHSIDRIDNNGNYEPGNCRWATSKQQGNNRRGNRLIEYHGKMQTLQQWADEFGISDHTLRSRLDRLWTVSEALNTPVINAKNRRRTSMDIDKAAEALGKECKAFPWFVGCKAESQRIVVTVSDVADAKKELPSSWCSYAVEVHKVEVPKTTRANPPVPTQPAPVK